MQKDSIKIMIKLFQLILCHSWSVCQHFNLIKLLCFYLSVNIFTEFIQFTDIIRANSKYITNIFLLYIVGLPELSIRFFQLLVHFG